MTDNEKLDDPLWEYVLGTKLMPYIPRVREFWEHIEEIDIKGTGVFPIDNAPPGLMYRMTNTPVRSPIKNIQVFPFVPVAYLQLTNVAGGAQRMVTRVCADNKFKIEEFTIVAKAHLPSTYHQGQFVAFIPTTRLDSVDMLGKWVYLTMDQMLALCRGIVPPKVVEKVVKYT